jgi:WD40 repeat protein
MGVTALSPNVLVTGSRDCMVAVWDVERQKQTKTAQIMQNVVTHVEALPGRSAFVQCSEDLRLRIWSTNLGRPELEVHAGANMFLTAAVSPDENYILCGSKGFSRENCNLHLFDIRTLQQVCKLPAFDMTILGAKFVGQRIVAVSADQHAKVFSCEGGVIEEIWSDIPRFPYTALGVQKGGTRILASGNGPSLAGWDVVSDSLQIWGSTAPA